MGGDEMSREDSARVFAWMMFSTALLMLFSSCGGDSVEMESHWSLGPISVDGRWEDWEGTSLAYFEGNQVSLGLRNDKDNVYMLFSFRDETWARLIVLGGVTLWLDSTGGKEKDFGIRYTGGPSLAEMGSLGMFGRGGRPGMPPPFGRQRVTEKREEMANKITLIDKKREKTVIVSADGSSGPAAAFAETLGVYTYEFSIPIREGRQGTYALNTEPGETIGIVLEWGGMPEEDRQQMMEEMGGGMRGGRRGGGRPGGPMGGSRRQPPERQEIWLKSQLASPEAQEQNEGVENQPDGG